MPVVINGSTGITSPGGDVSSADNTINGVRVGEGGGSIVNNTVLGNGALAGTNSQGGNTAIGYQSLQASTASAFNTAVGYQSAYSITTGGSNNTALGSNALYSNTTASNNTAVGYQAGYSNTTGTLNVAVGYRALYSTTTQNQNVAVGADAFYSNTTGYFGVAVGYRAGESNTTGFNNTVIGRDAGRYITTGSSNTIIGSYDGNQGGLDIRTASNYIVLSDGSGNPREVIDNNGRTYLSGSIATSFPTWTSKVYLADDNGVNVGIYMLTNTTSSQSRIFFNNPNGNVGQISTSGTSTAFTTSSDYRLKENVTPMTGALNRNDKLNPVTYTWKADGSHGEGFIAHELQAIIPDAVIGEKDAVNEDGSIKAQGIDTSFLVAHLVACVKELKAEVDSLKAQLNK